MEARFCSGISGSDAQVLRLGRGGATGAQLRLHLKRPHVAATIKTATHGVIRRPPLRQRKTPPKRGLSSLAACYRAIWPRCHGTTQEISLYSSQAVGTIASSRAATQAVQLAALPPPMLQQFTQSSVKATSSHTAKAASGSQPFREAASPLHRAVTLCGTLNRSALSRLS